MFVETGVSMRHLDPRMLSILDQVDNIFKSQQNHLVVAATGYARCEHRRSHFVGLAVDISQPLHNTTACFCLIQDLVGDGCLLSVVGNCFHIEIVMSGCE